jgi:hypothetical protein
VIVTDRRLTLAKGNDHILAKLHHETHDFYYLDEYGIFATGGSSGTRGVFVWGWQEFVQIACVASRYQVRDEPAEKTLAVALDADQADLDAAPDIVDLHPPGLARPGTRLRQKRLGVGRDAPRPAASTSPASSRSWRQPPRAPA